MVKKRKGADLFAAGMDVDTVPSKRLRWSATYRLIPSKYPPIAAFERVAPRADWDDLFALESLTNKRLRDEAGNIQQVPPADRVNGTNASVVMAPFTHTSTDRPTRFTDGTYGVYYAGHAFETALREVAFHMERFHAATHDLPTKDAYRCYKGAIDKVMHDVRGGSYGALLMPDTAGYAKSQQFAKALRDTGSNGIVYPSVRHPGGECIAAFRPTTVTLPVQERHVKLTWDGKRISEWFDFGTGEVTPLPPV